MILLAFLFPVSIYLLVLGNINSRRTALLVSGVWDFIGLLAAMSGFLLVGGPALLSSYHSSWREFWLMGKQPSGDNAWMWASLAVLYFFVVLLGCCFLLWSQRGLTAIYNIDPNLAEKLLDRVCSRLGLDPVRSGSLYLFGMRVHRLGMDSQKVMKNVDAATEKVILDLHGFSMMWHVTLRWDPVHPSLRRLIETELQTMLADMIVPEHELGPRLTLAGMSLFTACVTAVLGLILIHSLT